MNPDKKESLGLSTADALKQLHDDIAEVLKNSENKKFKILMINAILQSKENPILPVYSIFITILVIIGLIYTSYYLTALLLCLILFFNAWFVYREEKLKKNELCRKTKLILDDIKLAITLSKDWKNINYPHLCSPLSPCISLVWTYRDNELVNLPTALLVEGDFIVS